jgi:hypothetical protein
MARCGVGLLARRLRGRRFAHQAMPVLAGTLGRRSALHLATGRMPHHARYLVRPVSRTLR